MLFPTLVPSSLPAVVAQPDERHATEQLLCWSGMTDTEHIVQHLAQTKKKLCLKNPKLINPVKNESKLMNPNLHLFTMLTLCKKS